MNNNPLLVKKERKKRNNPNSFAVKWYHIFGFTMPMYAVIILIILIPMIFGFMISLYNVKLTSIKYIKTIGINIFAMPFVLKDFFVGLQNYIELATDPEFLSTFFRTIIWTFVNVFFHVALGIWLATILNRKIPGRGLFRILLILPWAIPEYIAATTWKVMFDGHYGAINVFLSSLKINEINWLGDANLTFIAAMIINIWLGFPFMMVLALGGLQSINPDLYEAADLDGANGLQKFWHITMPLLQPIMVPAIILGSVWTFNKINIIYILADNGRPAAASQILVTKMYTDGFNLYRYSYAATIGVVILIILIIFANVYMRISTKKEA